MHRVLKKDGLVARFNFTSGCSRSVSVSGDVYPFAHHFHSVRFRAERGSAFGGDENEVTHEIGFGGNTFECERADLVLKAGHLANDLAKYYAARMKEFLDPHSSYQALRNAFMDKDFEDAFEVVVFQPLSNDKRFVVKSSMAREHAPKAMTVLDMLHTFPAFEDVKAKLKEASEGSESAWDSPEMDILRVVFNGSESWTGLVGKLPENHGMEDRSVLMLKVLEENAKAFDKKGLFTTLKERYGKNR